MNNKRPSLRTWIEAFRPKTLPLAASAAIMGSFVAASRAAFSWPVFLLALSTSLLLQVLSNLANDYGDGVKGTDQDRQGPRRVLQAGLVTKGQLRLMIILLALLSLASGLLLIWLGLRDASLLARLIFLGTGLAAIAAAMTYTMGKNPYGYAGFGDIMVYLFFGLAGVAGTYYLHTGSFSYDVFLPASAIGFLSTGVLNLNNLRDRESDAASGKRTLVVRLGLKKARIYHSILLGLAVYQSLVYTFLNFDSPWQLLFLLLLPRLWLNHRRVWGTEAAAALVTELKNLSLTTFLFSLIFGLGLLL